MLDGGAMDVLAVRASTYVSDQTWQALRKRHDRSGCDGLADLARRVLDGSERLHAVVGRAAGGILGWLGRSRVERAFAEELARRIPLPVDAQLAAAARGLQIAGIYLCAAGGGGLADCACLRDVLETEGLERLQLLMLGALEDWQGLPRRMGDAGTG